MEPHLHASNRILRYVCVTLDYRLHLHSFSTMSLVACSDVDWGDVCPLDGPLVAITFSSATISYVCNRSINKLFLALVLKQNTWVSPIF